MVHMPSATQKNAIRLTAQQLDNLCLLKHKNFYLSYSQSKEKIISQMLSIKPFALSQ